MAEEHQSPIQRLEALERRDTELLLLHVGLEAQVLILDQIVGYMMTTGQAPTSENMMLFRANIVKQLREKYPSIQLRQEEPKPTLYVPRTGIKGP